ncbi:MAG: pimeloyl-ACP methyl ester carboxylesterase [Verrucomicrobiales bacterium]|jgi:pimeloyl-ACP methyl ester carboxylesterase
MKQRIGVRFRRIFLVFLVLAASGIWATAHLAARRLLIPNRKTPNEHHEKILADPAEFGLRIEPFQAIGAQGAEIRALWVAADPHPGRAAKFRRMRTRLGIAESARLEPRGTVFLLHGRGGCKEDNLLIAERFCAAGFNCVAVDLRAHGQSGGRFSTYGRLETLDMKAVIDSALANHGSEVGPIALWGISLGAAVAIQAAAADLRIEALISICAFADLSEVVELRGERLISRVGRGFGALTVLEASRHSGSNLFRAEPLVSASILKIPVMLIHAELDGVIPVEHARRIFREVPGVGKRLKIIPAATHGNVLMKGGDELYQQMIEFLLAELPD